MSTRQLRQGTAVPAHRTARSSCVRYRSSPNKCRVEATADTRSDPPPLLRREAGRAVAALIRATGSFDLAEEAVQDAFVQALRTWPKRGVPNNPAAWITLTARNKAIDRLRRQRVVAIKDGEDGERGAL